MWIYCVQEHAERPFKAFTCSVPLIKLTISISDSQVITDRLSSPWEIVVSVTVNVSKYFVTIHIQKTLYPVTITIKFKCNTFKWRMFHHRCKNQHHLL